MKTTQEYLAELVSTQAVTNEKLGQIAVDIERLDDSLATFRREVRNEINGLLADVKMNETRQNGVIQTNQKKLPESQSTSRKWPFGWHD